MMTALMLAALGLIIAGAVLLFRKGQRRRGLLIALAGLIGVGIIANIEAADKARALGYSSTSEMYAAEREAEAKAEAAEEAAQAAEIAAKEAERKKYGHHCLLTGWDGRHRDFAQQVENALRDPDSFEIVETRTGPLEDGRHAISMTFRARNGFGGMNVETAFGSFDHETCEAVVLAVE
jgi:hypothetical protein